MLLQRKLFVFTKDFRGSTLLIENFEAVYSFVCISAVYELLLVLAKMGVDLISET